jgi:uncharacterized protein (TIGR00252 family)
MFKKQSTKHSGDHAEECVAITLKEKGFTIIDRNWRTRSCEIDIVAQAGDVVYFVEVKYRSSSQWGDGFAYVTPKKLQQMGYAAQLWAQVHRWDGNMQLVGASVDAHDDVEMIDID